jgi:hypothetical protein
MGTAQKERQVSALKSYLYEAVTALALLGVALIYLQDVRLLLFGKMMLIALYVSIAVATEACIAVNFRPDMWRLIGLNVIVAVIVYMSRWGTDASLQVAAALAAGTLILRLVVAYASLKATKTRVFRIAAAFAGTTLLAEALATLYSTGERIYYDYYFYPNIKEDYIVPSRWQDFTEQAMFFAIVIAALYFSYRLLKYAFRYQPNASCLIF